MPRIIVRHGGVTWHHPLADKKVTVGCASDCDIRLSDRSARAARYHPAFKIPTRFCNSRKYLFTASGVTTITSVTPARPITAARRLFRAVRPVRLLRYLR